MKIKHKKSFSARVFTKTNIICAFLICAAILIVAPIIILQNTKAQANNATSTVTWSMVEAIGDKDPQQEWNLNPTSVDGVAPSVQMYYNGDYGCGVDAVYDNAVYTTYNKGLLMEVPEPDGYSIDSVTITCKYYDAPYDIWGSNDREYTRFDGAVHSVTSDDQTWSWTFTPEEISDYWTGPVDFCFDASDYSKKDSYKLICSISVTYSEIPTYTVSFVSDEESSGTGSLSSSQITKVTEGSYVVGYSNPCLVYSSTGSQLGSCTAEADSDSKFMGWTPNYVLVNDNVTIKAKFSLTHTLTIHYQDNDGNQLKADDTKDYAEGESDYLYPPAIESYKADEPIYEFTMGDEDAELTMTYTEIKCDEAIDFNFQKIFTNSEKGDFLYGEQSPWEPTYIQETQPEDAAITFTGSNQGWYAYCPKVSQDKELVLIDDAAIDSNVFTINNSYEGGMFCSVSILAKYTDTSGIHAPIPLVLTDSFDQTTQTLYKTVNVSESTTYQTWNITLTEEEAESVNGKSLYFGIGEGPWENLVIHDIGISYTVSKAKLSGTVLTDQGDPVEGASVEFTYDAEINSDVFTTTDANGKYSMLLEIGKSGILTIDCRPDYDAVFTKEILVTEDMESFDPVVVSYSELEIPIAVDDDSEYMHYGYHWALYKFADGEWKLIDESDIEGNCTATIFTGSTFIYEGNATLVNVWENPNVDTDIQRQTWTPVSAGEYFDFDSFSYVLPGEDPNKMEVDESLYIEDETFEGTAFTTSYIDNTPIVPPSPDVPGGEGESIDGMAATGDILICLGIMLVAIVGIAGFGLYRIRKEN